VVSGVRAGAWQACWVETWQSRDLEGLQCRGPVERDPMGLCCGGLVEWWLSPHVEQGPAGSAERVLCL
jgi:hypothetical protein